MKRTSKCTKCGSKNIIRNAKAIDSHTHDLLVAMFRNPDAVVFKGKLTTTLSAWVCEDCGFVEFYADEPRNINVQRS